MVALNHIFATEIEKAAAVHLDEFGYVTVLYNRYLNAHLRNALPCRY